MAQAAENLRPKPAPTKKDCLNLAAFRRLGAGFDPIKTNQKAPAGNVKEHTFVY